MSTPADQTTTLAARLRTVGAVIRLAATRQRARPWRGALIALGVAAAVAALLTVAGGGLVAADSRAARTIAATAEAERAIRVTWGGTTDRPLAQLDRVAADAITDIVDAPIARAVLMRETDLGGGRAVVLGAADDLARWIRLDSGRLPGPCQPQRCEVVQVLGAPVAARGTTDARLVTVGTATLTTNLPFGDLATTRATAGASFAATPVLLTGDRAGLSGLAGLSFVYRTYSWAGAVRSGLIHPWTVDTLLERESRAARLLAAERGSFTLTTPDRAVIEARDVSRSASRRMMIVGAAVAALLLAFAVLATTTLRQDHADELARLERRGAGRGLRLAFTLAERLWIGFVGVAIGTGTAVIAVSLIARRAGSPAGEVLRHSLLSGPGIAAICLTWLVVSAILVIAQLSAGDDGRRSRVADVVAVAAIATVLLAAARGGAGADDLARGGGDPLLPALPVLLSLAAGLVTIRVFKPLMRIIERRAAGAPLRVRLAATALARRPERAGMTAAFLVVGLGLAVFADSYRATLERGDRDQAAFAVPADAIVSGGLPSDIVGALGGLPGSVTGAPVNRVSASTTGSGSIPVAGTVLGVPASTLTDLDRWRPDFSALPPARLATLLTAGNVVGVEGASVPAGARDLAVRMTRTGPPIDLRLAIRAGDGAIATVAMTETPDGRLTARLPRADGATIVALEAALTPEQQISFGHANGEGRGGDLITGTYRLGALTTADARQVVTNWRGWIGRDGLSVRPNGTGATLRYRLGDTVRPLIRPRQAFDGVDLPVLVSQSIGRRTARGDRLTFRLASGQTITARVAAAVSRFPTLPDGAYAIADRAQLAARLDADAPGAGRPNEAWLRSGRPSELDAALRSAREAGLTAEAQADVRRRLHSDPLSRGIVLTLTGAALIALALGIVAVVLGSVSDVRDERRELADLATQGAPSSSLRGQLTLRSATIVGVAIVGGLVLGLALSTLVVRLVLVTGGSRAPVPPLVRAGTWSHVLTGLLLFAAAAVSASLAATRWSFRDLRGSRP